ncbi:MAG: sigma-70 family RNA polymerase sigma factor [Clostridiales bacterium]|jgi:RNA polymerase sigma factor (sigma-70 family)|nr:sigma-70 family RNA polymerase sigma factor [Clostridiales bacterium]
MYVGDELFLDEFISFNTDFTGLLDAFLQFNTDLYWDWVNYGEMKKYDFSKKENLAPSNQEASGSSNEQTVLFPPPLALFNYINVVKQPLPKHCALTAAVLSLAAIFLKIGGAFVIFSRSCPSNVMRRDSKSMLFFFQSIPDASFGREPDIDRLIDCYSQSLTRLCYLYLKDEQLAQEAVQDALYRAYQKYHTFQGKSSEKTWMTSIAINICKDYMRKPSYREVPSDQVATLSSQQEHHSYTDPDSVELLNMVYQLPQEYREVILMRYYQDLPVKEIASILKQRPNTVSVRLKRAREMLKLELEGDTL